MEIYFIVSAVFAIIAFVCLGHLSAVVDELYRELDNAKKHEEFLNKVIGWRDGSITELIKTNNIKENELAWYRNATNSEPKV